MVNLAQVSRAQSSDLMEPIPLILSGKSALVMIPLGFDGHKLDHKHWIVVCVCRSVTQNLSCVCVCVAVSR